MPMKATGPNQPAGEDGSCKTGNSLCPRLLAVLKPPWDSMTLVPSPRGHSMSPCSVRYNKKCSFPASWAPEPSHLTLTLMQNGRRWQSWEVPKAQVTGTLGCVATRDTADGCDCAGSGHLCKDQQRPRRCPCWSKNGKLQAGPAWLGQPGATARFPCSLWGPPEAAVGLGEEAAFVLWVCY